MTSYEEELDRLLDLYAQGYLTAGEYYERIEFLEEDFEVLQEEG